MIPVQSIAANSVTVVQPDIGRTCEFSVRPAWWKRRETCDRSVFNGGRWCIEHGIANHMARRCHTCNGTGFIAAPLKANTSCNDCGRTGLDIWTFVDTERGVTQRAHPQAIAPSADPTLYHISIKKL